MNDRYLYRAKRTDNGEWILGSLIQASYLGSIRSWISSEQEDKARLREISSNKAVWRAFEVRTDTICQCTGLKDKNGKLIWENDIIEAHLDNLFPEDISRFQVLWKDYSFKIRLEKELYDDFCDELSELFEVTGNIFDNPELLEVGA